MQSGSTISYTLLRITLGFVTATVPLLAIVVGGADLLTGVFLPHDYEYYSVDPWSLANAGWWLLIGMMGLLPCGWVLLRSQARLQWLGLPTILSLFVLLYPGADPSANERAGDQVLTHLEQVAGEVRQATEQAKLWRCASGPSTTLSPYRRAGERLFYQRVCVKAQQPTASLLASSAPGMIYIATSPNEQVVWLRATVLPSPATNIVRWLRVRSRESLLLAGERSLAEEMAHRHAD